LAKPQATDLRERPLYTVAEAARYLKLPVSTVRAWCFGQWYRRGEGDESKLFKAVIDPADRRERRLSFVNLVELLVLSAIRRKHRVSLPHVRSAIAYMQRHYPSLHPLADNAFQTDGVNLFIEKFGALENISQEGQLALKEVIAAYLKFVERDESGVPIKLYLPSRERDQFRKGSVIIDLRLGFGQPVINGTGIRTEIVVQRFRAGEPIAALAEDYGRSREEIEEIVRGDLNSPPSASAAAPRFFVDRGLGRYAVAVSLRQSGLAVEIHDDHFSDETEDVEWLCEAGRRGWIVLSKDSAMRRQELEVEMIKKAGAIVSRLRERT
jgi:uncharacterized protein (DUF433 family)